VKQKTEISSKKKLLIFWGAILLPVLILYVVMWGARVGTLGFNELPDLEELENPKSNLASEIITSDGKIIGKYFLQNRTNIRYEDLSPFLVDALIATEDERFREHSGIDFRGLVRAVTKFGSAGGASTITQQLAKMMFHEKPGGGLSRIKQKFQEWIIAVELEKRYTKDEIIIMYYNKFDFIYNAVGIKSACNVYFNKEPKDLKIEEAAVLVGMAKNPSLYNPKRFPANALKRREVVFSQMKRSKLITQIEYDSLRMLPLTLDYKLVDHKEGSAPYFRESLRLKLQDLLKTKDKDGNYLYAKKDGSPYNIYSDGLKIFSTLNSRMQEHAEWAVQEYIAKTLQGQFNKHLKRYRTKRYPYDGGWKGISAKQFDGIMQSSMEKTPRYRISMGLECENCGRRGKMVKKVGNFYQCQAEDCEFKRWATDKDSVPIIFDTKIKMKVFSHQGEIDTLFSPNDSIKYYKTFLHTGLMSVDPHTGYIKAWVGGVNYQNFAYDHVTSTRQVGSTFKPFVYATAIQEKKLSPCHEVLNLKYTFHKGEYGLLKDWTPKNSDGDYDGCPVSLKYALANSMNTITAWVMKQINPSLVVKLARNLGVTQYHLYVWGLQI
jgi:penicillin-binding protein 1A